MPSSSIKLQSLLHRERSLHHERSHSGEGIQEEKGSLHRLQGVPIIGTDGASANRIEEISGGGAISGVTQETMSGCDITFKKCLHILNH